MKGITMLVIKIGQGECKAEHTDEDVFEFLNRIYGKNQETNATDAANTNNEFSTIRLYGAEIPIFKNLKCCKEQALKPLEESAEIFGSYQQQDIESLLDECADTIQAVCNLAASVGCTDLTPYMGACYERNKSRGRY